MSGPDEICLRQVAYIRSCKASPRFQAMPRTKFTNTADDPSVTFAQPSGPITIYLHGSDTLPDIAAAAEQALPVPVGEVATSVIPPGSRWAASPHWHELHSEHFIIARGFALVRIRGDYVIVGSADEDDDEDDDDEAEVPAAESANGSEARHRTRQDNHVASRKAPLTVLNFPPFTIHGFSRADVPGPIADRAWAEYEAKNGGAVGAAAAGQKKKKKTSVRYGAWTKRDVVLLEWTAPSDGAKELFFRNGMSYFRDHIQPLLPDVGAMPPPPPQRRDTQDPAGEQAVGHGGKGWRTAVTSAAQIAMHIPRLVYHMAYVDNHLLVLDNRLGMKKDGGVSGFSLGLSHTVYFVAKKIGGLLGWRYWWEEYTPVRLREAARRLEKI
ncbi:hypothetical protein Micbo1qcDRAFT_196028 [Microdochium bolleyi]|uniref:Uncharacterized protein n=1 Tax=Microdochium bolleyi TaxID=196109 RepID=A0A136J0F2_9PEZI|nr:hypothetical protein Micbo1qcDRAFT_196028 [Microdochium bolleyi]